ncbi:MAG: VPLPA-CTERM sorting domain-containing protein [Pseudomonadota bacterium]
MRRFTTLTKTIGAAIGVLLGATVSAAALSFNFSFTNVANGGGTVTGIIRGLADTGFSSASSLEILSNSGGFGIGEYVGDPLDNLFEVTNGQIVFADFEAFGAFNSPPDVTDSSFELCILCFPGLNESQIGLTNSEISVLTESTSVSGLTISAVPLPAAFPLALAGLGILVALKRRRRDV